MGMPDEHASMADLNRPNLGVGNFFPCSVILPYQRIITLLDEYMGNTINVSSLNDSVVLWYVE